jgi:molecular chaperone HscA
VQGERELVADCRSLARFDLRGIPPMTAGAARIRVTFQVDADGLLSVAARELSSGVEAAVAVKPSYGLSDEQITQMLKASFDHANEDARLRALLEARVDGERLLEAVGGALAADGSLLGSGEEQQIRSQMETLRKAIAGTDHRAVKAAAEVLNHGSEAFAAMRMDRSVKQALTGRSIDKLGV